MDAARLRAIEADAPVFRMDDPAGGLFGVASGCVATEVARSSGLPQRGLLLHPGAWFGEGVIAGRPTRLVGARAAVDSALLCIELAAFRRVAARHPEVWRHVALLAVQNLDRTIGLAEDLLRRGSRERLAAILVRLAGLRDDPPAEDPVIHATQQEIAHITNLSRSVVSTLLPKMEREGLIALGRGRIRMLDADRLVPGLT